MYHRLRAPTLVRRPGDRPVDDPATTVDDLDRPASAGGAGLDRRAAEALIAGRPFDLAEIDAVPASDRVL